MMLTLTPRLISHISQDINNDRPIWAILRIMEYRESNPFISRILFSKAIAKAKEVHFENSAVEDLNLENLDEKLIFLLEISEPYSHKSGHFGSRPLLVQPRLRKHRIHQTQYYQTVK